MTIQIPLDVLLYRTKLTPLQQRYVLGDKLGLDPAEDHTLGLPGCLLLWLAVFLNNLPWLTEGQWRLLIDEMEQALVEMAGAMAADKHQSYLISFVDGKYATWTGTAQFLCLETGDWREKLEHRGFEHIGYDLLTLVLQETKRCDKIKEIRDATESPT